MTNKFNLVLFSAILFSAFLSSCSKDDDNTPTPVVLNLPSELAIPIDNFHPEDVKIVDNVVYVSGARNGEIVSFDLTQENPTAQTFAPAVSGYTQAWGMESDGNVLVSLLNNVDFTGIPPGPSRLVEYDLSTGNKSNEWDLPDGTSAHTVSIVDGKYYVTDVFQPKIIEVDPATSTVTDNWFTSPQLTAGFLATTYDGTGGLYASVDSKFWYIPISNGQAGTIQEVNVSGSDEATSETDGSVFVSSENALYYTVNDAFNPANAGAVYKLEFSNTTTASVSMVSSGFDDPSGVWYLENDGTKYIFVCESQFGSLFGLNDLEAPFKVKIETIN
ncbi:MAG: hypothetical protein AB8H12_14560 [Lewinella sp.]